MNQNNQAITFKGNPYQYIRGVRFQARIDGRVSESFKTKHKAIGNEEVSKSNLSELAGLLSGFHTELKSLLYDTGSETEKEEFRKNLSVSKTWLKKWHKELFYSQIKKDNNRQGKYALKDLKGILHFFEQKLVSWGEHSEKIKKSAEASKNERFRHSDIATAIRALSSRELLDYIGDFLMEVHTKSTELDNRVKKLKEDLENLREQLKTAEQEYLSFESPGIEIAKASFNYYTLNKRPKEYYEKEPQKAKDELCKNHFSKIQKTKNREYSWEFVNPRSEIFQFKSDQEKKWIEKYCEKHLKDDLKTEINLTLDQTYSAMKDFKAEQKSIFYEVITHIASNQNNSYEDKNSNHLLKGWQFPYSQQNVQGVNTAFSLFQFKEKEIKKNQWTIKNILSLYKNESNKVTADKAFEVFIHLTKQIQQSGDKKNKKTQTKKLLQHPKHRFLARRQNRLKNDSSLGFYNNMDTIPYKSQNPKKDRGAFLFGKGCYFKEYEKFCEEYKKIAQKRGRLNAQIKGIEKEKREALQTGFWAFIYTTQTKKQLWLVPKDKCEAAKSFIYSPDRKNGSSEDSQCLSCFESLTMRALHKLCFAEQSSFVKDMPYDLKTLQQSAKEFKTKDENKDLQEQKMKEKSQKELVFFKKLLKNEYAKEKLLLKNFNLQECYKAENLTEFEKSLEKACYHEKKISLTEGEKQDFLKKQDVTVLNISSYDLEGRNKNTYQTPVSANRYHTDLWQEFWKGVGVPSNRDRTVKGFKIGEIRLNPEVKIRYRKADEGLKKYFDKKKFPSKFKHRRLQEGFTVHFTLALNAGKRYEGLAFARSEELLSKINDFNQKLNQEINFKTAWKYGIDRGQKELATLCLVRFNPDKDFYQVDNKNILKPTFPKDDKDSETIKCWTLKNCNYKEEYTTKKGEKRERWAIKNLSYFVDERYLNNRELFEEENIACLDLTTAKVIKGKIITNGDVLTYLKLKKTVAKRQLYELFQNGKINGNASLEPSTQENGSKEEERHRPDGVLNIKVSNGEEKTIYHYRKGFEDILINKEKNIKYNQQSIKDSLNHYLNELRENNNSHTPTILKINHLRDAIIANMVGVICHLQKTYPGFVILEDLSKSNIDKHRFKNEENISRRLENALYNKFQSIGLVPPHVKNIIQLREQQQTKRKQEKTSKESMEKEIKNMEKKIEDVKKGINSARDAEKKEELEKKLKDTKEKISYLEKKKNRLESNSLMKENQNQFSQIGAIVFVPKEDTSKTCPCCPEKTPGNSDLKFRQHRFLCNNKACGFDTYYFKKEEEKVRDPNPSVKEEGYKEQFNLFKDINDNDKVAAYNVANYNNKVIKKMK
ncbi:MAG: hypothetical protein OXM55_06250 [Bdellovibrionales bacterium]|nr:hypothetical protein [Bdellovibrionales bacterium]